MALFSESAKMMGEALVQNATELTNQFAQLDDKLEKKTQCLGDDIASLNDKFTFMLESMAGIESMLKKLLESPSVVSVEEPEPEPVVEEEEPDVIITKVVQGNPKDVVVKVEKDTVSENVSVDGEMNEEAEMVAELEAVEEAEAEVEPEAEAEPEVEEEAEPEAEEEVEPEAEEEEEEGEEELSLVEKLLKAHDGPGKKKYYVTENDEREIYEILEDGEPGDEAIGKLKPHGKSFRAHYFKKQS